MKLPVKGNLRSNTYLPEKPQLETIGAKYYAFSGTAFQSTRRRERTMGNVTKKDIVDAIAERTGLTQVDTKVIVECFLDSIGKSLREGKNIEIRGFGRFKVKEKKARIARNPRTGDMVKIEAGFKPIFEASKELKAVLNSRSSKSKS
jgi:nucleoid DNA-binding protein